MMMALVLRHFGKCSDASISGQISVILGSSWVNSWTSQAGSWEDTKGLNLQCDIGFPLGSHKRIHSDPEFPFPRFTTAIQMLNCRYNDLLIAGDGFRRLRQYRQQNKGKKRKENSGKNINTDNRGVQAHKRAGMCVIKHWYNTINDSLQGETPINTLTLWTYS